MPGPIGRSTEIAIPEGTTIPDAARGKIVLHNDPMTDPRKAWPWEHLESFAARVGPNNCVLLGRPGQLLPGVLDLRGRTSLAQAAAILRESGCFVGIDSGLMWIAGSLQIRTVGLYGSEYVGRPQAVQPVNPNAVYLSAEKMGEIGVEEVAEAVLGMSG